jgi:putative membrane protein
LILLLLAVLAGLYLWRSGGLNLPTPGRSRSPEHEARRILAERFARGDITTDDFLERASILNWTPGTEALPKRRRGNKT